MSSRPKNSLIQLHDLSKQQILDIFERAFQLSKQNKSFAKTDQTAALIFLEASTRTRMSFETACVRSGLHPLILDGKSSSSLEKGETPEDTVLNVAAMKPAVMIIRSDDTLDLAALDRQLEMPILNAGWGVLGHPSQALLDAFTILRTRKVIENQKVLIVGDIRHSRVAASHFELSRVLGYEVALCGPANFMPSQTSQKVFSNLEEALRWADVVMCLRVQKERHVSISGDAPDYAREYGLNAQTQKFLKPDATIMHPGPINHGVEMDTTMVRDPRSVILQQVTNGIYIRQALVERALNGVPQ